MADDKKRTNKQSDENLSTRNFIIITSSQLFFQNGNSCFLIIIIISQKKIYQFIQQFLIYLLGYLSNLSMFGHLQIFQALVLMSFVINYESVMYKSCTDFLFPFISNCHGHNPDKAHYYYYPFSINLFLIVSLIHGWVLFYCYES